MRELGGIAVILLCVMASTFAFAGELVNDSTPAGFNELLNMAENGDVLAAYRLGHLLYTGEGLAPKNIPKAIFYLDKAMKAGVVEAGLTLAWAKTEHEDIAIRKEGVESIKSAYFSGYTDQAKPLADFLWSQGDRDQALGWYRYAAGEGNAEAGYNVAVILLDNSETPDQNNEAIRWLKVASGPPNPEPRALTLLGSLYIEGLVTGKRDTDAALELFARAAQLGEVQAQYNLAYLYFSGDGLPADIEKAYYWAKKAAVDSLDARELIGIICSNGMTNCVDM